MPNGLQPNLTSKKALSQWWADMASRAAIYCFIAFSWALLWWWDSGSSPGCVFGGTDSYTTFSFNALWYAILIHKHLCSRLSRSALPHKHILGTLAMQFLPPKWETSVSLLLTLPFTKVMTCCITIIRWTTLPSHHSWQKLWSHPFSEWQEYLVGQHPLSCGNCDWTCLW
jgi:hypothetical protein